QQAAQFLARHLAWLAVLALKQQPSLCPRLRIELYRVTTLRERAVAIEMEHMVEVRPIGQDAGQLFQCGRAQDIELDTVVVRADQFEQRTGDGLERHILVATGTADDHEDIKSLCRSWRT